MKMSNEIVKTGLDSSALEQVLVGGDLSKLTPAQRVQYYRRTCESIGLNPFTKPFEYIILNGKMTLYARKDCADQLRSLRSVSIDDVEITETSDTYFVKVKGHDSTGRTDVEIGVVKKSDMQGNAANAQMKAVTKAKRRLTLSICGLGWLDETEVETISDARRVSVNQDTGEIVESHTSPAMTYEQAAAMEYKTASKTYVIGELDIDKLNYIIEKAKNPDVIEAARVVLKHDFQATPPAGPDVGDGENLQN